MATYSSTTNPFLKSSSSPSNGLERPCKKEAPGMAMQQSLIDELTRKKEANLLLSNDEPEVSSKNSDGLDENSNHTEKSHKRQNDKNSSNIIDDALVEIQLNSDKEQNGHDENLSDFDEITRACKNLVEATVRSELEGLSRLAIGSHTETSLARDSQVSDHNQDDDDDDADSEADFEAPPMEQKDHHHQHIELIKKLRLQLGDLERYAYERGELKLVPPSVLAERQTVILETLRDRLSLNISMEEMKELELDELKKQVDKEIHDLIDPLKTKEHLLSQLQTQLTDLERYIAHLHGTLGKIHGKEACSCHIHGCSSRQTHSDPTQDGSSSPSSLFKNSSIMNNDALPKTSKLIRSLVTQLICSDIKLQESAKKEKFFEDMNSNKQSLGAADQKSLKESAPVKAQPFSDEAAWSLHIDRVVLATDSLVNLYTLEPQYQRPADKPIDEGLVESIVRRQLLPAIKDLLSYGLIDPSLMHRSTSYASLLFDPYYILSSLTCFPSSQKSKNPESEKDSVVDKIHLWAVIEDYYKSRNEPGFKSSSVKTLSQSFNLAPSISGPIKITSKQALLIAVDDIIDTLSKCKPNGPESHFKAFIYNALNRSKLPTWLRLVFKNKSVIRKYYHSFSFVGQSDKMDKFLATIEALNQFEFKLRTDVESIEQFVSAF